MIRLTKICFLFSFCCSLIAVTSVFAQEEKTPRTKTNNETKEPVIKTASGLELKTYIDKASYGIGTNIGQKLKANDPPLNLDAFIAGLKTAFSGKKSDLTDADLQKAFITLEKESRKLMIAKRVAEKTKQIIKEKAEFEKEGADLYPKAYKYLQENKKKKGVVITKSGLQYEILKSGKGATPTVNDNITAHYEGKLIDGKKFDSSYDRGRPETFPVSGVVSGWTEVLQLMKEGDKWRVTLPPYLAYGKQGMPGIPKNAVLIFEMELIQVGDAPRPKLKIKKADPKK